MAYIVFSLLVTALIFSNKPAVGQSFTSSETDNICCFSDDLSSPLGLSDEIQILPTLVVIYSTRIFTNIFILGNQLWSTQHRRFTSFVSGKTQASIFGLLQYKTKRLRI